MLNVMFSLKKKKKKKKTVDNKYQHEQLTCLPPHKMIYLQELFVYDCTYVDKNITQHYHGALI